MSLVARAATIAQAWPVPAEPRPIVAIGAGGIMRSAHFPAYRRLGLPIAGVFDVEPAVSAALAADFDVPRVFSSLAEACAVPSAVFDVAVPAGAVARVLGELPRGAGVLIQKPLGRDLAEARQIAAVCRERQLTAAVNFQLRFSPGMLALRALLEQGAFGTVTDLEVRVRTHTPWGLWDFLKYIPRHEIIYHSIHYLDAIRSLLGEPRSVFARVTRHPELPEYADVSSVSVLDYGDACRCLVNVCHAHDYGPEHAASELVLEGTRGAAVLRLGVNLDYPRGLPDRLQLADRGSKSWSEAELRGSWFTEAFEGPICNLQRFLAGDDARLESSIDDALRTMALVEACYESSAQRGVEPSATEMSS